MILSICVRLKIFGFPARSENDEKKGYLEFDFFIELNFYQFRSKNITDHYYQYSQNQRKW
jgi:hypothetical protein